ncbi:hypothetical protein DCO48_09465 [Pseudomonas sp. SDI]|uniref:hypothetical protein n=1 Tax=Pseudomonas sp. SDI TaxID=2170734 RepID=UPI000DE775FD|nr:hypothetical protein [Pseudomonas sp. SDI]PWB33520.1 hypothetical protein DCO48_09465 [Pseudomonas sp. SDI]
MNRALLALNAIALAAVVGLNMLPDSGSRLNTAAHAATSMQARPAVFNQVTGASLQLMSGDAAQIEHRERLVF